MCIYFIKLYSIKLPQPADLQTLAARYLVRATNLGLFLIHQEPEVGHAKPQNYIFLEADAPHTSQTTFARMCGGEH